jgi:GST-like protein
LRITLQGKKRLIGKPFHQPKGNVVIKFYYHPSPNPAKVALFLEEAGLDYEVVPVDTRKGEQFKPEFLAINPNAKTPALTDGPAVLFDSTAILLYLAEKTGRFVVAKVGAPEHAQMLSWLMFVATGIGPYGGQAVHFKHFAPDPKEYPLNRYMYEAERHWGLVESRLGKARYMVGEIYSIVDMSVWGWARALPFIFGPEAWQSYPNVKRLVDEIDARPAAVRASALASKYSFKQENDEAAKKHMFPQNQRLVSGGKA